MISEALELCMKGGRVCHSCCMCVVCHCYGDRMGSRYGGGGWYACGTKPVGFVACWEMPEHFQSAGLYTDDTRSYRFSGAQLWVGSVFLERP